MNIFSWVWMKLRLLRLKLGFLRLKYAMRRAANEMRLAPSLPTGPMTLHGLGDFMDPGYRSYEFDPSDCPVCSSEKILLVFYVPRGEPERPWAVAVGCHECGNKAQKFEFDKGDPKARDEATAKAKRAWTDPWDESL